jgi:hypothetical protein
MGTFGPPCRSARCARVHLYPVLAALILGLVTGGSPSASGGCASSGTVDRARHGLQACVLDAGRERLGDAAVVAYVLSAFVLAAVAANLAIHGLWLSSPAASQLPGDRARSGYMPVSPATSRRWGPCQGGTRTAPRATAVWRPDRRVRMPVVPLANVFSVGDLLIGVGGRDRGVAAMHGGPLIANALDRAPTRTA